MKNKIKDLLIWELILIALFIPLFKMGLSILIGITCLTWIVYLRLFGVKYLVKNLRWVLLFMSPFFFSSISVFYSTNFSKAIFDLEVKLTIFLMPLIIFSLPSITEKIRNRIFIAFVVGCFIGTLVCFINASYLYFFKQRFIYYFFYTNFSVLFHPSYFSMYISMSIIILLYVWVDRKKMMSRNPTLLLWIAVLYFIFVVILLGSKTGLLALFAIISLFSMFVVFVKKELSTGIRLFVGLCCVIGSLFVLIPVSTQRIEYAVEEISHKEMASKNKIEGFTGNTGNIRLQVWECSLDIIKDHFFFGTGNGDVNEFLQEKYTEKKMMNARDLKLNAHNQYIQTFLELGLFGFIAFLGSIFYPLYIGFRNKNLIFIAFVILITVNFISESMLNTRSGVVFCSFFNSILFFFLLSEVEKNRNLIESEY